jgi:hypothetical protein
VGVRFKTPSTLYKAGEAGGVVLVEEAVAAAVVVVVGQVATRLVGGYLRLVCAGFLFDGLGGCASKHRSRAAFS